MFEAGALRVMPSARIHVDLTKATSLDRLAQLAAAPGGFFLTTAYPQAATVTTDNGLHGLVDHAFRVDRLDNVYVCDASVFPVPLGIPPRRR